MNKGKAVADFTTEDGETVRDLFVEVCRAGVKIGFNQEQTIAMVLGFLTKLEELREADIPLTFITDNPKGTSNLTMEEIVRESKAKVKRKYADPSAN